MWAGYAASLIEKKYGVPYIINEHRGRFAALSKEAEAMLKETYRPFLEAAYQGASKVVSVSDALHYGIRKYVSGEQEFLAIPNLVDTEFFSLPAPRVQEPFVVLSIGRPPGGIAICKCTCRCQPDRSLWSGLRGGHIHRASGTGHQDRGTRFHYAWLRRFPRRM